MSRPHRVAGVQPMVYRERGYKERTARFAKAPYRETCKLFAEYFPEIPEKDYRKWYNQSKLIPKGTMPYGKRGGAAPRRKAASTHSR